MQWVLFAASTIVTYIGIALFAQLSGGSSSSALQAFFSAIRPVPLILIVVSNMFFGLAVYYGLAVTRFAIPIAIAIGALTSFLYSTLFLGAQFTLMKLLGIGLLIVGIVLLGI